jgi:hypothetical protein
MPTKKLNFFQSFLLFEDTFTSFFTDKKSQRSHITEVGLLFLLDDGGDPDPNLDQPL